MAETQSATATNVTPIAKTREQSKETKLKLQKRKIERELEAVDSKVAKFEAMKKELGDVTAIKASLTKQLTDVKAELIKELGLG